MRKMDAKTVWAVRWLSGLGASGAYDALEKRTVGPEILNFLRSEAMAFN